MTESTTLQRLIGVYDADHTVRGEVAYWIGAKLGRRHCALCDITHGSVREKRGWQSCKAGLPVTFDQIHRDERSADLVEATGDLLPVVVADTDPGLRVLLGPDELATCGGDPDALVAAIAEAVDDAGLEWPIPSGV
jgi:hypothetical protein